VSRQVASAKQVASGKWQGKARGQQGKCQNERLGKLQLGKQGQWPLAKEGEASGKLKKGKARQGIHSVSLF